MPIIDRITWMFFCASLFLVAGVPINGHTKDTTVIASPFNQITKTYHKDNLTIIAGGHFFGNSSNSLFSSPSVLANLDLFDSSRVDLAILLGDNIQRLSEPNIRLFRRAYLNQLNIPVFNAVGNHDISPDPVLDYYGYDPMRYTREFGDPFSSFVFGHVLILVIDTENSGSRPKGNGFLSEKQIQQIQNAISRTSGIELRSILLFGHKEINLWTNNFHQEIVPLFSRFLEKGVKVIYFSGDKGLGNPSVYQVQDTVSGIHFYHSHIQNDSTDNLLEISVQMNGDVEVKSISLIDQSEMVIPQLEVETSIGSERGGGLKKVTFHLRNTFFLRGVLIGVILVLGAVFTIRLMVKK